MAVRPTPIVVLSSRATRNQMQTAFEAIRRGALEVLPKPEDTASWQQLAESLPETVRAVAEAQAAPPAAAPGPRTGRRGRRRRSRPRAPRLCAGWRSAPRRAAPPRSASFFEEMPADPPVSFLIVQHIASGFELGFADWLNKEFPLDVQLARDGERPRPGAVRLAPGGSHLLLEPGGVLHLDADTPARRGHRPSADELFLSCADCCPRRGGRRHHDRHGLRRGGGPRSPCARPAASPWRRTRRARSSSACRASPWRRGGRRGPAAARPGARPGPRLGEGERGDERARPGRGRQRGHSRHPRPHPARRRLRGPRGPRRRGGRPERAARAALGRGHRLGDADHGRLPAPAAAQGRPAELPDPGADPDQPRRGGLALLEPAHRGRRLPDQGPPAAELSPPSRGLAARSRRAARPADAARRPAAGPLDVLARVARQLDASLLQATLVNSLLERGMAAGDFHEACRSALETSARWSTPATWRSRWASRSGDAPPPA